MLARTLLTLCLLALASPAAAAPGDHQWSLGVDAGILHADAAPDGHQAVAGMFFGSIDFGGGPLTASNFLGGDVFVARLDASGQQVSAIQVTPDQFCDVQVVRVGPAGDTWVFGQVSGDIDFGGGTLTGSNSIYAARFDASGAHVSSTLLGSFSILDAAIDATGFTVGGSMYSAADLGGGTLTPAGSPDAVVARYDHAGAHQFSTLYGNGQSHSVRSLALASTGPVLGVSMQGTLDFGGGPIGGAGTGIAIVRLAFDGSFVSNAHFSGNFSSSTFATASVGVDGSDRVVLGSELHGSADLGGGTLNTAGNGDLLVGVFDATNQHVWSSSWGDGGIQALQRATFGPDGAVVFSGNFRGTVDFGGGPLAAGSNGSIFVARLDGNGAHEFSGAWESPGGAYACHAAVSGNGDILLAVDAPPDLDLGGGPLGSYYTFIGSLEGVGGATAAPPFPALFARPPFAAPNPFNPRTTIRYELRQARELTLSIYDARGRLVARPLWRQPTPAGPRQVRWDASGLPSGSYRFVLEAGGERVGGSTVLVR